MMGGGTAWNMWSVCRNIFKKSCILLVVIVIAFNVVTFTHARFRDILHSCYLWQSLIFLGFLVIYSCLTQRRFPSRKPRGLWSGSSVARLLELRVRIPPKAWLFLSYECWVLSSKGLCDWLIPCPGEPYWAWSTGTVIFCTYNDETEVVRRLNTVYCVVISFSLDSNVVVFSK
jgi:hypothetical protein